MTRRDTKAYPKLRWAALAGAVLVLLAGAPALAQEVVEPDPVDAVAAETTKYCEGKYKLAGGGESIITTHCPNHNSTCTCTNTGIDCGGNKKDAPAGSTFVEGSCKQSFVSARAADAEVLEALYRAIFEPEE